MQHPLFTAKFFPCRPGERMLVMVGLYTLYNRLFLDWNGAL